MASAEPIYTGLPELIDMELATSADFHVAATNFTSILDDFINEIAVNYIYRKCRTSSDPITCLTEFYVQLNEGTMDVQGNAVNTRRNLLAAASKALLSDDEVFILKDDTTIETRNTNGEEYHVINIKTKKDRWIASDETSSKVAAIIANMSTSYGFEDMDEEFILHWRDRFNREHPEVVAAVNTAPRTVQESDDYLKSLSDSIGILLRVDEYVSNSDIPAVDVSFSQEGIWPNPINPVAQDKIDDETLNLVSEMSRTINGYSRSILINAIDTAALPEYAHGEALVGDSKHRFRISTIETDIESKLAAYVGQAYRLLLYIRYKIKGNRKLVHKFTTLTSNIERSEYKINVLKDRLTEIPKSQTNLNHLT